MDFTPNPNFQREYLGSPHCHDVIADASAHVRDVFKRVAPQDTGRMVASTRVEMTRAVNGWQADVVVPVITQDGRRTRYAKFVEFGTRYMRAQHNLRHALEIVSEETW